jgi:hypothetical protein
MSMMISPYAFAPAVVTYSIAVQDFVTPTATGTQNYTSSSISGITPKAVFYVASLHQPANDPSETANASWSVGAYDGTTDLAVANYSQDAQVATNNSHIAIATKSMYVRDTAAVKIGTSGLISGGASINYTTAGGIATRAHMAAFTGSGTTAKTGTISLGTGTSAITVTTGFQPDAVILFGAGDAFAGSTGTTYACLSMGFATSDGTQRCVIWTENNGSADGKPLEAILTARCGGQINASTGALNYHLTASNFTSTGFDITPNASAGSDLIGYLALKFTGQSCKILDITTPTSTGSQAITGAGFKPQFAMAVMTNLEAVDPTFSLTTSDLMDSLAICTIGDEQWSTSWRIDSGAATTDTRQNCQNYALMGGNATATDAILASLTSFDSDGLTLNYSAVQGTAKKGFMLCIQ